MPRFLTSKEKTAIKTLVWIIVVSLFVIATKYASGHIAVAPAHGGDYKEASVGGPRLINPLLASSNDVDLDLIRLIFSGLMKTNAKGELAPDLASSYEISPDGKTYAFHLKENVEWHDGTAFTSSDVAATFSYIKDPAWKSPLFAKFANVSVEAPDAETVKFVLAEPFAPFLSLMTVGILPDHLWQNIKPKNAARAELNIKPVGTGPFRFKNFTKGKKGAVHSYTVIRNERFYGGRPYLSSITFTFQPDSGATRGALEEKKADGLSFLPPELREEVLKTLTLRMYTLRLPQYNAVFFNQNKNTLLQSKNVRQALALSIDKDALIAALPGKGATPVHGPIPPGFIGFHSEVKKYGYDPAAAADLLERDGWKIDTDGVRKRTTRDEKAKMTATTVLAVKLTTVDSKENIAAAQLLKQNWQGIGAQTEIEVVPASKILKDKIRPRDYEALLYGEILGPDPDPYPFWHSSQNQGGGLNLTVMNNKRVDELLEKARLTTKSEERAAMYREFQDILAEDAPAIFLYSPTYTYVVSRKIKGIEEATIFTPADRFTNVTEWYVKTRRVWR